MGDGAGGPCQGGDAFRFDAILLQGQQLAAHLGEGVAQFPQFGASPGRNRIGEIAGCKGFDSGNKIIEGVRDSAGNETKQEHAEEHGKAAGDID